jgi:KRAB domain-containing zinc finger protein
VWRCHRCNFSTEKSNKEEIDIHLSEHKIANVCHLCKKTFRFKRELKEHLREHAEKNEENKKGHVCYMCGFTTFRENNLKLHMLTHSGKYSKWKCPYCDEAVKNHKVHIDAHVYKHTQQKQHVCTICDHKSITKSALTRHMKVDARIRQTNSI